LQEGGQLLRGGRTLLILASGVAGSRDPYLGQVRPWLLRVGVGEDEEVAEVAEDLDDAGEELLDVRPSAGLGRADRPGEAAFEGETGDEDEQPAERDRFRAVDGVGEVEVGRVEAGEVGLEIRPVA
jgi:hypothetical protein